MRLRSIIVAGLMLAPVSAFAQEATPAAPPAASAAPVTAAPATDGAGPSDYRVLAIAAGAVVGVAVVEFLSGGTLTPVLVAGAPEVMAMEPAAAAGAAPMDAGYSLLEVVKVGAGAIIGGYVGNALYGK